MPYGEVPGPGLVLWTNVTPLTTAASPLVSPWIATAGITRLLPWFSFTGGTSVHSLEGSIDGSAVDTEFAYAAPTSGTEVNLTSPFIRWRTVQTVANATVSKIVLRGRL